MRIISLIASSTEIVCALGMEKFLVGRSHECDFPPTVSSLPVCTAPKFQVAATSAEIDRQVKEILQVREITEDALSVYRVDAALLASLEPTHIITQTQCEVCAVSLRDVEAAVKTFVGSRPEIISLQPNGLADVWSDIERVAEALGIAERGHELVTRLRARMTAIERRSQALPERPTVACMEWIDPLMASGNWMPDLVRMAGGRNLFGEADRHSPRLEWSEVVAVDPEMILILPCGFDIARTRQELPVLTGRPEWSRLRSVRMKRTYLLDGNQYFNRPGPRLAESLEILAELIHPEVFIFWTRRSRVAETVGRDDGGIASMLRVTLNGQPGEFPEGASILDALRAASIAVPTLCYDPRLKPGGACRLCVVSVKGWPRAVPACSTPLAQGMQIETHTPDLEEGRRVLLQLLARDYPREALRQFPEKEFHRYLHAYGLEEEAAGQPETSLRDDSHPYIHVDMAQCIYCYRCVRICAEVQGQFVWHVLNRGDLTRILPDSGKTLRESSCVSCGACVDACPSGALEDKTLLLHGVPTEWVKTTCPYCGTGCEMRVGTRDQRIVTARPALEAPVSKGHLCVKGRYAFAFNHAEDRRTRPMIRERGEWRKVGWDEAVRFIAAQLQEILQRYGPESVGVLGSARATNEENYVGQKFARVVLGTNNVDCCARVCHAPTAAGMQRILGTGAATNSFDDIEKARALLVCGANPTENHPIVGARIKQAALRGASLIVIDPRRIELARYASIHLPLRPGTNVALLNAMACAIVEERLYDEEFVRERISEWEEFREFIRSCTPEHASAATGVEAEKIREAARLYATSQPAMCIHGLGLTEHVQGTDGVMCLVNLALLTGNVGKPGSGVNPLRGQNNVQGSAHMGCEPSHLAGYVSLEKGRELFESVWRTPLPSRPGMNLMEMMDAAAEGRLKALWAIGYDIFLTNPNSGMTRRALESVELLIVQDIFLNETAREFATVFLPAASSFEKEGTFMNAERRIQMVRQALDPPGEARSDWQIVCDVGRAMGKGEFFAFDSAEEIWNEVRQVWKGGQGISYARMELKGVQWPCPAEDHPGTEVLHAETFAGNRRAALRRVEFSPTTETTTPEFPFLLTSGRTLYQFNAGTMTLRTANTELHAADFLDVSSDDAAHLALENGERVRIRSRYGETVLPLRIHPGVKPGELFATFHTAAVFLNRVTGPHRDGYTLTPEYKVTAVRIEKA